MIEKKDSKGKETPVGGSSVQEVIDLLRQDGVKRGQEQAEAILAEARQQAEAILAEARQEAARLIGEAKQNAKQQTATINGQIEVLVQNAMLTLPQVYSQRVSDFLAELAKQAVLADDEAIVTELVLALRDGSSAKQERLEELLSQSQPHNFLQLIMLLAVAFYAKADGCTTFTVNGAFRPRLMDLIQKLEGENTHFEFTDGSPSFTITRSDKSAPVVEVSAESLAQLCLAWASGPIQEAFNQVWQRKAKEIADECCR